MNGWPDPDIGVSATGLGIQVPKVRGFVVDKVYEGVKGLLQVDNEEKGLVELMEVGMVELKTEL